MKKLIFLFAVLFSCSQFVFTSCDKEDDEPKTSLYGTWIRENSMLRISFTFNADYTGKLVDADANTNNVIESFDFKYSFDDHAITIDWGHGGELGIWSYRILGNKLSLEEEPGSGNFREYTKL